ncbi:MAG: hypothetical protein ACYDDT_07555 [Sulfuricella sp.]
MPACAEFCAVQGATLGVQRTVGGEAGGIVLGVILPQGAKADRDRAVMGSPCGIVRLRGQRAGGKQKRAQDCKPRSEKLFREFLRGRAVS